MRILRLLSAGIIATGLAGTAQADALNFSFNSADFDPFVDENDVFSTTFTTNEARTVYILTYGFSGGEQADGTTVASGGFDSALNVAGLGGPYFNDNEGDNSQSPLTCIQDAVAFAAGSGSPDTSHGDNGSTGDACLQIQLAANETFTVTLSSILADDSPFGWTVDNNFWAFDILGVQFAEGGTQASVPAPGLIGLFGVLFAGFSVSRAKRLAAH